MILGEGLRFGEETYHPDCFNCSQCETPLNQVTNHHHHHHCHHHHDDIYNGEVSVCQQKSLFLYSKDLGVSHVSRHIPYSKNLVVSPVYRHFPYSRYLKVSRNSKTTKSLEIMTFQGIFKDTFCIQGILLFYCF